MGLFKNLIFYLFLVVLAVLLLVNSNLKTIGAGVAILLFGMIMLEEGFRVFTKGPLQNLLKKATHSLYKSIGVGALVTALIQSSSLVSVITISFISAGLIGLSGGIGLVFGANIGTTATAWLVAISGLNVEISGLAMPMLVFGVVLSFQKKATLKGIGQVLAGLGFFFLGIHYMKEGFDVFKSYIDLTQFAIPGFWGVIVYTGLGIVVTTILQSSSATLALILTALAAGQIEYENALALGIGANVGTTITAVLGSLGSNVAGRRLAGAHFIFNVVTGLVALVFIYPLASLVNVLSGVMGIAATDYTLKLALFHTIFNVLGVLIMIPFIKRLEGFLKVFIKERVGKDIDEPKFLNKAVLQFPSGVILSLMKEAKYLYENAVFEIVAHGLNIRREDIISSIAVKEVVKQSKKDFGVDVRELYSSKVKTIYGEIIRYATTAQSELKMTKMQNTRLSEIRIASRKMVEIIEGVRELGRNVAYYLNSDNEHMSKEYDRFRKKIIKVLRVIYLFRTEMDREKHYSKLIVLKEEARKGKHQSTKSIDKLIRNDMITVDMASSLVNDNDHVNDIVKKLIEVAELLYGETDSLLVEGN